MTEEELRAHYTSRKRAYQLTFGAVPGQEVLDDLERYCRAYMDCVVPGDRDRTFVLLGQRNVFLRIKQFMELTPEQLFDLHTRPAEGAIRHDGPGPNPDA